MDQRNKQEQIPDRDGEAERVCKQHLQARANASAIPGKQDSPSEVTNDRAGRKQVEIHAGQVVERKRAQRLVKAERYGKQPPLIGTQRLTGEIANEGEQNKLRARC